MLTKNIFNPECITYSQMSLIFNSRIYYRRLITWTRAYILSRYFGIGNTEELFGRLYLESLGIGNMLQIIFGRESSQEYGQYLSQFAITFRDLISAQLEGDTEAVNRNVERLYQNVAERAAYLETLNPYWSEEEYKELFGTYIQYVIGIANAIASGNDREDIALYDSLSAHASRMGDVFAQGLYDYVTSSAENIQPQGGEPCITYDQMNAIFTVRMFWFELATWIRNYMLSRYSGVGDAEEIYARLMQAPDIYNAMLQQIFEEGVITEEYIQSFYEYIELINAFITAQMEGNIDAINEITRRLYQNVDERAAFITSVNPFVNEEEARNRFYNDVRSTIEESTSFLMGDYARNIDIFSTILDQAESTGNYFTRELFNFVTSKQ